MIIGGLYAFYRIPGVSESIQKLYESTIGDVVEVIKKNSKEDIDKAYKFGVRILGLVASFSVILLIFESLLGLVLRLLMWPFIGKSQSTVATPTTFVAVNESE